MLPYWILFAIPAFGALFERPHRRLFGRGEQSVFFVSVALICMLIGFRYEVGADWTTYIQHLLAAQYTAFEEIPTSGDPGYVLLNWLTIRLDGEVWWVNLFCGLIFSSGLFVFSRDQPRPWLALAIAVPYLVIVVAMGYTRQGVALGFAMLALVALARDKSTQKFIFWIVCAALFHKSAVLLIPIAALANDRGRLWSILWVGAAAITAYFTLLADSVDQLMYTYIEAEYDSAGALIRVVMNAVPAGTFLVFRNKFSLGSMEKKLWVLLSIIAVALIPILIVSPSSTAVDRLALYLIPLQLMVFSRMPDAFANTAQSGRFLGLCIVGYCASVQFVWLNFAGHTEQWLPYQFYPL